MARHRASSAPLHIALQADPEQLRDLYDRSAQQLLEVVLPEGYFDSWDRADVVWPASRTASGPIDEAGLEKRVRLVDAMYRGVPPLRDERLSEAYQAFRRVSDAYHEGNRMYLQARRGFATDGKGSESDFLQLYQSLLIEALAEEELRSPDSGEASLGRAHLARVPLSHAQTVAAALPASAPEDDPRWEAVYTIELETVKRQATLRELLTDVVRRTLEYIAAGELFATRFNTYHNFGWFGASAWKVVVEADLLRHRLLAAGRGDPAEIEAVETDLRLAQGMMIEFLRAHTEDPSKLKPEGYWYGQEYSYLTRDMIDLTVRVAERTERLLASGGEADRDAGLRPVELPPLFSGRARGRFLPYPDTGRERALSPLRRGLRLARWAAVSYRMGSRRKRLARRGLDAVGRRMGAWKLWTDWGDASLRLFGARVDVTIDPRFRAAARELDLGSGRRKMLFLPTHQSLLDHPVMYKALSTPELWEAMGWEGPVPCVILARTGMALAGVTVGRWSVTMFAQSSEEFDRSLEELDGYVTLERSGATGPTTTRVASVLADRPGIIYPMATTAAFESQCFPLQHALFAQLPADVVIVPIALRGIHSLWPKCPKGNLHVNPGRVEVVVSPPILGETTLLPKRRSLRIQLETSALIQTVHVTSLLNPEPAGP